MQLSNFLRTVLKLDAASCFAMAAIVIPMSAMFERPFGIDTAALTVAAVPLIPIGLFVLWLGTRREAPASLVALVIAGNVGWAVASFTAAGSVPAVPSPALCTTWISHSACARFLTSVFHPLRTLA